VVALGLSLFERLRSEREALGFCGLAPGALRRERPSSDALCASMMDSDVGWRPAADGRSASIRPGGSLLSARAPSLFQAEIELVNPER